MGPAPLCVALSSFPDQDAKSNAGAPVTFIAQLVKSDYLGFRGTLRLSGSD